MFNLCDVTAPAARRNVVGQYSSFAAARAAAFDLLPILCFEADDDYEGCADMITEHGALYVIEPA